VQGALVAGAWPSEEFTPYKFHVSEDIYTSIELHSDPVRTLEVGAASLGRVQMLSPQDLLSWTVQRFKYAGGSLDILFHDNPAVPAGACRSGSA
jgi:cellulose synthase (UDP-forming)